MQFNFLKGLEYFPLFLKLYYLLHTLILGGKYSGVQSTEVTSLFSCHVTSSDIAASSFTATPVMTPSGWACQLTCVENPGDSPGSVSIQVILESLSASPPQSLFLLVLVAAPLQRVCQMLLFILDVVVS